MVPLHDHPVGVELPGVDQVSGPGGSRLICRSQSRAALEEWLERGGTLFDAAAADPRGERLEGRGIVHVVPGHDGDRWVVRHYRRGGAVASLLGDCYLRLGRSRPVQELEAAHALRAQEIPTPKVVAAAWYPNGLFYRADLVTRFIPDSSDLAAILFQQESSGAFTGPGSEEAAGGKPGNVAETGFALAAVEAAGRLIRRAQDVGLRHPDLNLKNILITGADDEVSAYIVDLDRARVKAPVGQFWRRRMVRRFWRSARKFERRTGRQLPASFGAAFDRGYNG